VVSGKLILHCDQGTAKRIPTLHGPFQFVVIRVLRHPFIQNALSVSCWLTFTSKVLSRHRFRLPEASSSAEPIFTLPVSLAFDLLTVLSS